MPFCPNCGSEKVQPSTRHSWWRGLQQSLGLRHFLCDECYHRFTVRGRQADEPAPRSALAPPPGGQPAPEPYPDDGPIYLEAQATPDPMDLDQGPEERPAPPEWQADTADAPPEPETETRPGTAPFLRPEPEPESAPEPEPGLGPATGFGPFRREPSLEAVQPRLDFAGPALEGDPEADALPRAAASWLGLWRKLALGLALLLICLALLLWYRLNLDSPGQSPTTEQVAQSRIKDEPLSLPPAPTSPGASESAAPAAKPAPTVGAIPPPTSETPAPATTWPPPTTPAPSAAPAPAPGAPALAPSAKPRALEEEAPAPLATPAPARTHAAKPAPTRVAAAKPAPKPAVRARAKSPAKASASRGGYSLQFGAFSDPDRAMALAAKLKGMGYKVDLVLGSASGGRSLTKVRSGHYPNAQEARKARLRAAALTAMEVVIIPPPRP